MSSEILSTPYNGNNVADNTLSTTGVIDVNRMDHLCTRNYDGTSGAMEVADLLLMMIETEAKYEGQIFLCLYLSQIGTLI